MAFWEVEVRQLEDRSMNSLWEDFMGCIDSSQKFGEISK